VTYSSREAFGCFVWTAAGPAHVEIVDYHCSALNYAVVFPAKGMSLE